MQDSLADLHKPPVGKFCLNKGATGDDDALSCHSRVERKRGQIELGPASGPDWPRNCGQWF